MKSPWSSKGEYTGDGDCKLVLTCQPANAGECELRIPPVVDDAIPKPQSSDKATLSLNWEPVVIHFSREVKTPIKIHYRSQSLTSINHSLKHEWLLPADDLVHTEWHCSQWNSNWVTETTYRDHGDGLSSKDPRSDNTHTVILQYTVNVEAEVGVDEWLRNNHNWSQH